MNGALWRYAESIGAAPAAKGSTNVVLWAAVYPGNGGRHGFHVHQGSISSCVLYVRTSGSDAGPIVFLDPRGSNPVEDYEQHVGEYDYQPTSPFHRSEYLFP